MPKPTPINAVELEAYRLALSLFDWTYEYSDCMDVWRAGKTKEAQLLAKQKVIDPTGEIWMQYKPADCGPLPSIQKEHAHG